MRKSFVLKFSILALLALSSVLAFRSEAEREEAPGQAAPAAVQAPSQPQALALPVSQTPVPAPNTDNAPVSSID